MSRLRLPDPEATETLGRRLAQVLQPPLMIGLRGELGAGKTSLVRGLVNALLPGTVVKSPTYGLVESYPMPGGGDLHHLDLYRLRDPAELEQLGLDDLVLPNALILIEWPERGEPVLPARDLDLVLHHAGSARELEFVPYSVAGAEIARACARSLDYLSC